MRYESTQWNMGYAVCVKITPDDHKLDVWLLQNNLTGVYSSKHYLVSSEASQYFYDKAHSILASIGRNPNSSCLDLQQNNQTTKIYLLLTSYENRNH